MKKFLTIIAAFILGLSAYAEDYTLYYDSTEGAKNNELVAVAQLQKLTFENGNLVLTMKNGTTKSASLASIKRLFFATSESVSIDGVKEDVIDSSKSGETVYDLTGRKLNVDVKNLTKGIYIVDGKKILVK